MKSIKNYFQVIVIMVLVSCGSGTSDKNNSSQSIDLNDNQFSVDFVSDQSEVTSQSQITLSWSTNNASSCVGSGDWSGVKAAQGGQETIFMGATGLKKYIITCNSSDASMTSSRSKNINVTAINFKEIPSKIGLLKD